MKITSTQLLICFGAIIAFATLAGVLSFSPTYAQSFNQEINYQGKLTASTSAAVADANYDMTFRLYTVPTGGAAIWTEARSGADAVPTVDGLFSVMLGSTTPLTSVDFNQTLYLGVEVEGDGEMTPRKVLGAVPAAFEAENAQTLDNIATSSFLRSDQADSATGLLTFTGGFITNSSSTISELNTGTTTVTTLSIDGQEYTTISGGSSGLTNNSGTLTANISESNLNITGAPTDGYVLQASSTATGDFTWVATTTLGFNDHDTVTLAGTPDYLTLSGQEITLGLIDLTADVTGLLDGTNIATSTLGLDTDDIAEGANLYYTDSRARSALSETITGITYTSGTGVFSLDGGYIIPLSASTTNWNTFYDTPSTQITAGTNIDWSGNTLNVSGLGDGTLAGLSDVDTTGVTTGDLLSFNGASWATTSTSSLNIGDTVVTVAANDTPTREKENADYIADGTADEVQIQAAIDALPSSGGKVELLAGTYDIAATVDMASNTALVGQGVGNTTLVLASAVDAAVISLIDTDDTYLTRFSVDGNSAGQSSTNADGIVVNPTSGTVYSNNVIDGVEVYDAYNYGIDVVSFNLQGTVVTNSIIRDNGGRGVYVDAPKTSVTNNRIYNNTSHGLSGGSSNEYFFVSENEIYNNGGYGISTSDFYFSAIADNRIYDNTSGGIYTIYIGRSVIDGNAIYSNDGDGISTNADVAVTVSDNSINNNTGSGIVHRSGGGDVIFSGNQINSNGGYGLYTNGGDDLIVGNFLSSNGGASSTIYIDSGGDGAIITDNYIADSAGVGYAVEITAGATGVQLSNNAISGSNLVQDNGTDTIYDEQDRVTLTNRTNTEVGYNLFNITGSSSVALASLQQTGTGDILDILDSAGNTAFTVTNAGDVGIGSTTPSSKLTVAGNGYFGGNLTATGTLDVQGTGTSTFAGNLDLSGNLALTGGLYDSTASLGTDGMVLQTTGSVTQWVATSSLGFGSGDGTVTSVDMSVPTGLAISGNPITTSGTLALTYDTGYAAVRTASTTNWNTFYDTPSTQITAGTNIDWSGNTLNVSGLGDGTFLGLSDTPGSFTSNRLLFTNSGGNAVTDSASLTFDGTNLDLAGANTGLAFQGTRFFYASTTNDSIAIGENAGANFTNLTTNNVAIGFEAGQNASDSGSDYNSFIGHNAGKSNTGASNNIFGRNAGLSNSGANNNIFGLNAGTSNTGGSNNILGNEAGRNNTGSNNNIFGDFAGYENTGSINNLIGRTAGYFNTGSYNNILGNDAGFNNTGSYSEFIGFETGGRMSASSTVAIGGLALRGGSGNPFSGNAATTTNNTVIGYGAGYNVATGGDNNLLLGYQAADSLTTGANNIVIGYDVEAPSNTASNQLNIGNLIFGTGIDGTGTTTSSGNIGIGTSSPSSKLDVWGDFRVGTGSVPTLFADAAANVVAIGTTTTGLLDEVSGLGSLEGNATLRVLNDGQYGGSDNVGVYSRVSGDTDFGSYGGTLNRLRWTSDENSVYGTYNDLAFDPADATDEAYVTGTHNLLTSTSDSGNTSLYGVVNDITHTGSFAGAYGVRNIMQSTNDVFTTYLYGSYSRLETHDTDEGMGFLVNDAFGNSTGGTQYGLFVDLDDTDTTNYSIFVQQGSGDSYFGSNVGIGTTSPSSKLDVWGDFRVGTGSVPTLFADTSTNWVGIGTTSRNFGSGATTTERLTVAGGGIIVNSPTNPQIIGGLDTAGSARGVTVAGRYAYVADQSNGLEIIDVSDPTNPTIVGGVDTAGNAYAVTVAGRYAYVADSSNGLEIIDVSDPTNPTIVGGVDTAGNAYAVTVAGRYAYVADSSNGLEIIDVSDPTNPTIVGGVDTAGNAYAVTVAGRYAYVADHSNGLEIIDVSDPTNPTIVGGVDTTDLALGVTLAGRYAYVADHSNGLEIIDVSDPTNPTIVGGVDTAGNAYAVTVAGRYAYVADDSNGLEIIDVSDPTNPTIVGGVDTAGNAYAVTVAGRYAYVADRFNGLEIIDIGGSEFSSLFAGALGATQANIDQDLTVGQNALVQSNLNVGNDARVGGLLSIQGYSSSTDTRQQALLSLGGESTRNSFMSFLGGVSSTTQNTWSLGLDNTDGAFRIASSSGLTTNNYFSILNNGNVGIGTSSPDRKLTVQQTADYEGLRIYGADDEADTFTSLSIGSGGETVIQASAGGGTLQGWGGTYTLNWDDNNFTVLDNIEFEFGTDEDYGLGYNSSDDTFRIFDGNDVTSDVNTRLTIDSTGNIGIGTTTPTNKLSIAQSADGSGVSIYGFDDRADRAAELNINAAGQFSINVVGAGLGLLSQDGVDVAAWSQETFYLADGKELGFGAGQDYAFGYRNSDDSFVLVDGTNVDNDTSVRMSLTNTGNIGIGTTSPSSKLTVAGDTYIGGALRATGTVRFDALTSGLLEADANGNLSAVATSSLGLGDGTFLGLTDTPGSFTTDQIFYQSGSAVTSSADFTFDGSQLSLGGTGLSLTGSTANIALGSNWLSGDGGDEGVFVASDGDVGIGTASPGAKFEVVGDTTITNTGAASIIRIDRTDGTIAGLRAGGATMGFDFDNTGTFQIAPRTRATINGTSFPVATEYIQMDGSGNFDVNGQFYLEQSSGNVGIGTTSPSSKLTVIGNGYFGGNLTATGTLDVQGTGTSTLAGNLDLSGNLALTGGLYDSTASLGTDGMVLQTTGSVTQWVATSTLGLGGGGGATTFLGLSDTPGSFTTDQIFYQNGSAVTSSADFTFDGTNLDLAGTNTGLAFQGTRFFYATTTLNNIAIGEGAGENMIDNGNSGDRFNIFLGYQAGQNASSTGGLGNLRNNFLGYNAGQNNTGRDNNLFGSFAGRNNTGRYSNLFGYNAGQNNTGSDNNLFGRDSGSDNTGSYNNILGYFTGYTNTGSYNNLFGADAGYTNTGSYSEFIGFETGAVMSASSTVAIGGLALRGGSGSVFSGNAATTTNNTVIGYGAGYNVATGGDNNLLLGYQAADSLTTGANNIVIGYDVEAPSNTASNQLNIGNLIFSEGIDGTGTTLSSGNIGIGTTSPASKLDVWGNFRVGTGSSPVLYANSANGQVSIGTTTSSSSRLSVYGDTNTGIDLFTVRSDVGASNESSDVFSIDDGGFFKYGQGLEYSGAGPDGAWVNFTSGSTNGLFGSNDYFRINPLGGFAGSNVLNVQENDNSYLVVKGGDAGVDINAGNVGIGTTSPSSKLTLENLTLDGAGVSGLDQNLVTTNSVDAALQYGNRFYLNASNTATTTIVGSMYRVADNTTFGNTVRGLEVQTNQGSNTQGENTALSGFARTFGVRGVTSGDAGGDFEPAGGFFESEGTTQGNAIRGFSSSITTASLLSLFQDTSSFTGTGLEMNFGNSTGDFASTSSKYLDFQNAGTSVFTVSAYGTTTIGDGTTNNMAGLQIGYGGLCVDNDGTCAATTTGQIASVSTYTGNSDLAEMYFSSTALKPGEVVTMAGELSVERAAPGQPLPILGVVSTKPGVVMGADDTSTRAGESAYPIALSGRVPVRLSTENGPIAAGDELMLSSIPGVAMKATGTGQTIGIALEDFDVSRKYSPTYINQFGDDMVDPIYEPIATNDDPRIDDGCYYGGGSAAGEAPCEPLRATTSAGQIVEANERAAQESVAEQLADLARERSERATLPNGQRVDVGQAVMFVERSYRWLDGTQQAALVALMSTTTVAEGAEQVTVIDRVLELARNFVDGVLTLTGLKADKIETNELCIDGVCVTGDELRQLLDGQAATAGTADDVSTPETEEADDAIDDTTTTDTFTDDTTDGGTSTSDAAATQSPDDAGTTTDSTSAGATDSTTVENTGGSTTTASGSATGTDEATVEMSGSSTESAIEAAGAANTTDTDAAAPDTDTTQTDSTTDSGTDTTANQGTSSEVEAAPVTTESESTGSDSTNAEPTEAPVVEESAPVTDEPDAAETGS